MHGNTKYRSMIMHINEIKVSTMIDYASSVGIVGIV
jgi:hypothetical protein